MLKIIDLAEAKQTILKRKPQGEEAPPALRESLARVFGEPLTPAEAVRRIIADVRANGDEAVSRWTEKADGQRIDDPLIPPAEWQAAYERIPEDLRKSLTLAAERIRAFHSRQPIPSWTTNDLGGTLGPAGHSAAASRRLCPRRHRSPALVAFDVGHSRQGGRSRRSDRRHPARPRRRRRSGFCPGLRVSGQSQRALPIGGAQAVAALAFGTQSIPRVDKIVGAGNIFVTLAKQQVFGIVGLDGLAGPTETVVIADDGANPAWVAADLLAQAEHDRLATAILLTPSRALGEKVQAEVARQIESRGRADIIAASLSGQGGIVITPDLASAVAAADEYAPEHMCLSVADPDSWKARIRNAGGLFIGERSFEVLGDYTAGPSHVMPTGGTARFASPLNVLDFVRITNLIALDEATAARDQPARGNDRPRRKPGFARRSGAPALRCPRRGSRRNARAVPLPSRREPSRKPTPR